MTTHEVFMRHSFKSIVGEYGHGTKTIVRSNREAIEGRKKLLSGEGCAEAALEVGGI
jgi:hypothetical protein